MTLYLYILIAHWLALLAATREQAGTPTKEPEVGRG
jgi:hypothetical protein